MPKFKVTVRYDDKTTAIQDYEADYARVDYGGVLVLRNAATANQFPELVALFAVGTWLLIEQVKDFPYMKYPENDSVLAEAGK